MKDNIVNLAKSQKKKIDPYEPTVEMLEELLVEAKAGTLRSMVVCASFETGGLAQGSSFEDNEHLVTLIAGLSILKARLVEDVLAQDEEF